MPSISVVPEDAPGMLQAIPNVDPSVDEMGTILTGLRNEVPPTAVVGGAPAEKLDLQEARDAYFPIVVGIILTLGVPPAAGRTAAHPPLDVGLPALAGQGATEYHFLAWIIHRVRARG